jgi:hypothetical protein
MTKLMYVWVLGLAIACLANGATIFIQETTIDKLIEANNQRVELLDLHSQYLNSTAVQHVELERRIAKLELQIDLMVAASRSSWADAYRLMRNPDFQEALGDE